MATFYSTIRLWLKTLDMCLLNLYHFFIIAKGHYFCATNLVSYIDLPNNPSLETFITSGTVFAISRDQYQLSVANVIFETKGVKNAT